MGMGYTAQPNKSIGVDLRMKALRMKNRLLFGKYFSRGVLGAVLATAAVLTLFSGSSTKSSNQIDRVLRTAAAQKKHPSLTALPPGPAARFHHNASNPP